MAPFCDLHAGVGAVDELAEGTPRAPRVVDRGLRGEAQRHPLPPGRPVVGNRDEVADERLDDAVAERDRAEHRRKIAAARPPELVDVARDDPVRPVLGGGHPRHSREPLALEKRAVRHAEQANPALGLVPREDVLRPVRRRVVGDDHEVDARGEVEREVLLDDVALVPDDQGHDDLHGGQPSRPARAGCAATAATWRASPGAAPSRPRRARRARTGRVPAARCRRSPRRPCPGG